MTSAVVLFGHVFSCLLNTFSNLNFPLTPDSSLLTLNNPVRKQKLNCFITLSFFFIEKKLSSHDHAHPKGSKQTQQHHHQHRHETQPHRVLSGDGAEQSYKQQHGIKGGSHTASSRPSSGMRHLMSRHLSDNTALHKSQLAEASSSYDADVKAGKSRGKLLSGFSLE